MASAVKTRKMTAHKGPDTRKGSSGNQRSPPKITRYTLSLPVGKDTSSETGRVKHNTMPTPTWQQIPTGKNKRSGKKVRENEHVSESDSEVDEISVNSDDLPDNSNSNIDVPYASLGELEQVYTTEIDPRELALTSDNIPVVLFFLHFSAFNHLLCTWFLFSKDNIYNSTNKIKTPHWALYALRRVNSRFLSQFLSDFLTVSII